MLKLSLLNYDSVIFLIFFLFSYFSFSLFVIIFKLESFYFISATVYFLLGVTIYRLSYFSTFILIGLSKVMLFLKLFYSITIALLLSPVFTPFYSIFFSFFYFPPCKLVFPNIFLFNFTSF